MEEYTPDFTVNVQGVKGACATGDAYASQQLAAHRIPVLSCEGPCIRGEIARLAANLIAQDVPSLARACHGETFFVPHSAMATWVTRADKVVMIDGCFLKCHGRILSQLIPEHRIVHIDTLPVHRKYNDVFLMEDVPEEERKALARQVADAIIATLEKEAVVKAAS